MRVLAVLHSLFLTLYATAYSGNSLLGYPGRAYRSGFEFVMSTGFMLSIIVVFHALVPRGSMWTVVPDRHGPTRNQGGNTSTRSHTPESYSGSSSWQGPGHSGHSSQSESQDPSAEVPQAPHSPQPLYRAF